MGIRVPRGSRARPARRGRGVRGAREAGQFGGQVPQALVQRGFAGGVGGEAVLEGAEARGGARVGGHEDEGAGWDGGGGELEDGGGDEEGADGVGCEVVGEFGKGSGRGRQCGFFAKILWLCRGEGGAQGAGCGVADVREMNW